MNDSGNIAPEVADDSGNTNDRSRPNAAVVRTPDSDIELVSSELTPSELREDVNPQRIPFQERRDQRAFGITVGLLSGSFFLLVLPQILLILVPTLKDTWIDIFRQMKELTTFILGAVLGYWLSERARG